MNAHIQNLFKQLPESSAEEQFLTLFENAAVKIERIVSQSHSSPEGFWYDQSEGEWVMVLQGHAVLEFEGGPRVEMKPGDYLLIPSHVKHRVNQTAPETVWLALHIKQSAP
jgi:cupin 2 domain-containing protein